LSKKQKNLQLLILGSSKFAPGYFESIKTKINRESLSKIAIINDAFLPNDLLKTYVVSSDVYIFPNEKQTWGLAAIEAMALGKACIVSDEAGVHEIVEDGENGLIFKCRDVEDLTKKMEKLIKDNKLRERIGKNARKFVLANFSWENYAKSMMDIFQEVAR
jgi:glycosyltransferase involved in cell wall biosynthesis